MKAGTHPNPVSGGGRNACTVVLRTTPLAGGNAATVVVVCCLNCPGIGTIGVTVVVVGWVGTR